MNAVYQFRIGTLRSVRYIARPARGDRYSYTIQDYCQMMSFIPVERLTIQEYSLNESSATGYVSWPTPPKRRYDIDAQACISTWHKRDVVER
jgi:hypothetical protein